MTIQGDLFSLGSTITVLQRRDGRLDPGIIEVPTAGNRQQMRSTIRKRTEARPVTKGWREGWKRLAALFAAGAVATMALGGCAVFGISKDSDPAAKQKVVAQRAEARWQSLIKGDLDAAYAYLSEGSKATTSLEVYKIEDQARAVAPGQGRKGGMRGGGLHGGTADHDGSQTDERYPDAAERKLDNRERDGLVRLSLGSASGTTEIVADITQESSRCGQMCL